MAGLWGVYCPPGCRRAARSLSGGLLRRRRPLSRPSSVSCLLDPLQRHGVAAAGADGLVASGQIGRSWEGLVTARTAKVSCISSWRRSDTMTHLLQLLGDRRSMSPPRVYSSDVPRRGGGPSGERSSEPEEPSPRNDHRGQPPPRDAANAASTTERGLSPTNRRLRSSADGNPGKSARQAPTAQSGRKYCHASGMALVAHSRQTDVPHDRKPKA
jgi:hypothetical protein